MSIKLILSAEGTTEKCGKQINNTSLCELNAIIAMLEEIKLEMVMIRKQVVHEERG